MARAWYFHSISGFLKTPPDEVAGRLALQAGGQTDEQLWAWREQVAWLRAALAASPGPGRVLLEFEIPRFGQRIDAVVLLGGIVWVLEFKVGEREFKRADCEQVWDYGLDLKYFHQPSYDAVVVPVLIATEAPVVPAGPWMARLSRERVAAPLQIARADQLAALLREGTAAHPCGVDLEAWESGRYLPTPTIVEAAVALFRGTRVTDILRNDAEKQNLAVTAGRVAEIIRAARAGGKKAICFVTGVPGAGKTLVGLTTAARHNDRDDALRSVYLSGNQPLVSVLKEALARDHRERLGVRIGEARREVRTLIQMVHGFRDDCLRTPGEPPQEHVALFDEAQRAWDRPQIESWMKRKKHIADFGQSEPEYLISCLDRHRDWATIVCLVGEGQEINTGEAGIGEWLRPLMTRFPGWQVYLSPHLRDVAYGAGDCLQGFANRGGVSWCPELHLAVSVRSFRAENVSRLVQQVLDRQPAAARATLQQVLGSYPIRLTRDLDAAKRWVREQASGSERYGLVASSAAERLRPHAVDVRSPMDPVHWFLDRREDVRSSYYLEQPATEFQIQGLELDWACVTWDADLRWTGEGRWAHCEFHGQRWNRIQKPARQQWLENAYRVLLTRARQGMVIFVPEGSEDDPTRDRRFYDPTFEYLREAGFPVLAEGRGVGMA